MRTSRTAAWIAATIALAITARLGHAQGGKTFQFRPVTGAPTGDLIDSRYAATATVLANGHVLIVGGVASENSYTASAELYDPDTGGFARTGSLSIGRAYHTAALLKDGRVLIAGGIGADGQPVAAAEIYDPASGKFSSTGKLIEPRYDCTATTLSNGKVLLAGGNTNTQATVNLDTAELFDPAAGTFGAAGNITRYYDPSTEKFYYKGKLTAPRGKHTATALKDGTVLIAGGGDVGGIAQASAELYDPVSGKTAKVASMNVARQEHRATLMDNGDVLITGGVDERGQVLATAEIYHPATRRFMLTTAAFPGRGTNLSQGRYDHAAALLPSGQVLIAGGSDGKAASRSAELYDPSRGAFACIGGQGDASVSACPASMNDYRIAAVTARLSNGEVMLAGGYNFQLGPAHNMGASQSMMGGATAPFSVLWSGEVYNPAAGVFVSTVSIAHAHFGSPAPGR